MAHTTWGSCSTKMENSRKPRRPFGGRTDAARALDRGAEGRDLAAGDALAQCGESLSKRLATIELGDGDPQLVREGAAAVTCDLAEAGSWTAAGGGANGEQVKRIRQRGEQATVPAARLALQQCVGQDETGRRHRDGEQQRCPPRRRRGGSQGRDPASDSRDKLRHQQGLQREPRLETGAAQTARQTQAPSHKQQGGTHSTTRERRRIATKPAACSAAASASSAADAGAPSTLVRKPGWISSAKRAPPLGIATTSRPVKRAWAVADFASSATRSRSAAPSPKRRSRPARSPPARLWLSSATAKASTPAARIPRRHPPIASTVGAPSSSSAPRRASSTAAGPSTEAAAAGSDARSERPAASQSATAAATSRKARSTAWRERPPPPATPPPAHPRPAH